MDPTWIHEHIFSPMLFSEDGVEGWLYTRVLLAFVDARWQLHLVGIWRNRVALESYKVTLGGLCGRPRGGRMGSFFPLTKEAHKSSLMSLRDFLRNWKCIRLLPSCHPHLPFCQQSLSLPPLTILTTLAVRRQQQHTPLPIAVVVAIHTLHPASRSTQILSNPKCGWMDNGNYRSTRFVDPATQADVKQRYIYRYIDRHPELSAVSEHGGISPRLEGQD